MNLSELIRRELAESREADPHVIGRRILSKLSDEMRLEVLTRGVAELVAAEIRFARMAQSSAAEGHAPGPSRRSVAMRERVCVHGQWQMLDDCGVEDLLTIADEYRTRSGQMAAKAVLHDLFLEARSSAPVSLRRGEG